MDIPNDPLEIYKKSVYNPSNYGSVREVYIRFSQLELPGYIVPPTFSKTFDNEMLRRVWNKATRALSEADNIYFIGYSVPITDMMLRYLFALGTLDNDRIKRIVVVNPDENIRMTYDSFLGTYSKTKVVYDIDTMEMSNQTSHHRPNLSELSRFMHRAYSTR